jgi:hypothetical protein
VLAQPTPPGISDAGLTVEASSADKFEMTLHKDAKFWDSVANRKQKAKKRKARKFLSNQQERFSIGDDFKTDDASMTEVNFYSNFTTADATAKAGQEGGPSSYSGLSDMDLIMQLAELEGGGGATEEVNFTSSAENPLGLEDLDQPASRPAAPRTSGSKSGSSELAVLEELERELGLDSLMLGSSSTASASGAGASGGKTAGTTPAASTLSDDDNLDELEKYLQSLGNPK